MIPTPNAKDYSALSKRTEVTGVNAMPGMKGSSTLTGVGVKVIHGGAVNHSRGGARSGDASEDIGVMHKGIGPASSFYTDKNSTWMPNAAN